jgi:hypothetical protein
MADKIPDDPIGGLREAAASMHELYLCYQEVGFTEDQAFALVKTALAASLSKS